MSLTSHLADSRSRVRKFFDRRLPDTRALVYRINNSVSTRPMVGNAELEPHEARTVGTAFDYRVRAYLRRYDPWRTVAAQGLQEIVSGRSARVGQLATRHFTSVAREFARNCRPGRELVAQDEAAICRCCVALAYYEQHLRRILSLSDTPLGRSLLRFRDVARVRESLRDSVLEKDIEDLGRVFVRASGLVGSRRLVLNPTFEGGSWVEGADADLIADGLLLELKTTKMPRPAGRRSILQLLGYAMLDQTDKYAIRRIGIYFARRSCTWIEDLDVVLREVSGRTKTLKQWRREALPRLCPWYGHLPTP